jgi:cold shock CspA family protein
VKGNFIGEKLGIVQKYDRVKGSGWIDIPELSVSAFISHREIIQEHEGTKIMYKGDKVKLQLYRNPRGFEARQVIIINEDEFTDGLEVNGNTVNAVTNKGRYYGEIN